MLSHGTAETKYVWVNTQLVEILYNNWPEIIASYKTNIQGEHLTSEQRHNIRKQHGNTIIIMPDGTNYSPLGGGIISSGRCFYDIVENDKLMEIGNTAN